MKKITELAAAEYNPRVHTDEERDALSKSIELYGDLSVLVFNKVTGNIVSGHMRVKNFTKEDLDMVEEKRFEAPTEVGTVAYGHVVYKGERFPYREVEWDLETEVKANVSANGLGGRFDMPKLQEHIPEPSARMGLDSFTYEEYMTSGVDSAVETMRMSNVSNYTTLLFNFEDRGQKQECLKKLKAISDHLELDTVGEAFASICPKIS